MKKLMITNQNNFLNLIYHTRILDQRIRIKMRVENPIKN